MGSAQKILTTNHIQINHIILDHSTHPTQCQEGTCLLVTGGYLLTFQQVKCTHAPGTEYKGTKEPMLKYESNVPTETPPIDMRSGI